MAEGISRSDSPLHLYSPVAEPVPQSKLSSDAHYSDKAIDELDVESMCRTFVVLPLLPVLNSLETRSGRMKTLVVLFLKTANTPFPIIM